MKPRSTLLGLDGFIERGRINELIEVLSAIWRHSMGTDPSDLESDLDLCRRWFDPVAQGQRLRRDLSGIRPLPEGIVDPGPPFTFPIGPDRCLMTPEGRCALDLLEALPGERDGQVVKDSHLVPYDRLLAHLYREWSRHRLSSVVGLLTGEEKPLQIAAAGVVIALLVNRSTNEARALKRFPSGSARDVVDDAFFQAVTMFSKTLAPRQRATRDPRLISGWMLYEARRRLGDDVLVIEGSRPDSDGRIWIDESMEERAIEVVCRDLARGHRPKVSVESLGDAFDSLVAVFRQQTDRLAGFGLAHERPANTKRLRSSLLYRFGQYSEEE